MSADPHKDIKTADTVVVRGNATTEIDETVSAGTTRHTLATSTPPAGAIMHAPMSVEAETAAKDTLVAEELARNRLLAIIGALFAPGTAALLPVMSGDSSARWVSAAGLGVIVASNLWLLWLSRSPMRYTAARATVYYVLVISGLHASMLFFGSFSGGLVVHCLYLLFAALSQYRSAAWGALATTLLGQLGLGVAFLFELMPDPGVMSTQHGSRADLLAGGLALELAFVSFFVIARYSRRALASYVHELHRMTWSMAQRNLLLAEARRELAEALRRQGQGTFTDAILGSYRLGRPLGNGAMGEVYYAEHRETGQAVAVKVLLLEAARAEHALKRFAREAELAQAADSEHVARVLEFDIESGVPYIAMELLQGEDLATILVREQCLSAEATADLVSQVAVGLSAASRAGVVHRDIKPQNLFRSNDGTWKILDFGVSTLESSSGTLTEGRLIGTPNYMPPEQAVGDLVDARCDVYALGAVAYHCLTGRIPFRERDLAAVVFKIVHASPHRPSQFRDVSELFDLVLAIAMAKDRDDRFETAAEFSAAFAAAASGHVSDSHRLDAEKLLADHPWSVGNQAS